MKVAIDATALSKHASGARTRAVQLYGRIAAFDRIDLRLWISSGADLKSEFKESNAEIVEVAQPTKAWQRGFIAFNQPARAADRSHEADLFCAEALPLPRMSRLPSVVTLHDLRFLTRRYVSLPRWIFARTLLSNNLNRARVIVTVSEAIKKELIKAFPVLAASKIHVVSNSAPPIKNLSRKQAESLLRRLKIEAPFFLCLGHMEPRKNLRTLVQGFALFKQEHPGAERIRLVIAGRSQGGITRGKVADWAGRAGRRDPDDLVLTGAVNNEERAALLSQAKGAVQPSCYEGFGLGVLEALAQGIPTVCSRITAHQEIAGDGALFFAPHDPRELSAALARAALDESVREALTRRGPEAARRFSWDRSAEMLVQLWSRIVEGAD